MLAWGKDDFGNVFTSHSKNYKVHLKNKEKRKLRKKRRERER